MSPRTMLLSLVKKTSFAALLLAGAQNRFDSVLIAQEAPAEFKTFEPKLKTDKDISEKRKEKDRARSVKTDKIDLAPIDAYYLEYILPRLTLQEPEVINSTRFDIFDDINTIEGNPSLLRPFNDRLIKWMTGLINRDAKGKTFSPATRINAAIILGRLHSTVPKSGSGAPVPDAAIHPILLSLIDSKEIDGLSSAALTSLARHLGRGAVKENVVKESDRKLFVAKLKEFIEAPKPVIRSAEAHCDARARKGTSQASHGNFVAHACQAFRDGRLRMVVGERVLESRQDHTCKPHAGRFIQARNGVGKICKAIAQRMEV